VSRADEPQATLDDRLIDKAAARRTASIPTNLLERPDDRGRRVTPLELFFDLVFVFAITQVTGFVSAAPSWTRLVEGLAILAVLWFAWSGYAWLGNTANSDEGLVRVILLAAMAAMLIASLAVPHAFGRDGLIFGVAYFVVRALHIGCYAAVARARNDATLAAVVARLGSTILPAAALLVLAGALSGTARAACWVAALLVDYGGLIARGVEGWRIEPGHFAERHSAIIIIALGESIVAIGVGARATLAAGVVVASLLGTAVAVCLWWLYFDVSAIVARRRLAKAKPGRERNGIARDSYSYLHFPMVAGIALIAVGIKVTLADVHADLELVPAVTLLGGAAAYLLAHVAFRLRNMRRLSIRRLACALLLLALLPLAVSVPALATLSILAGVLIALIAYEAVRYADVRDRIRHQLAREPIAE
jgi:low temperature requirement protein LtrA